MRTSHQLPSCTPCDPGTQRLHTWHGTRFARTTFCTLFILGIALVPREVNAGTIYTLVDHPDLQNGYHLTGTIETNGSLGTQTTTDFIQSWSVLITKPDTPDATFSSPTNAGAFLSGSIIVTPSEIDLPLPPQNTTRFSLIRPPGTSALLNPNLSWFQPSTYLALRGIDQLLWASATVPTEIATVTSSVIPEPSSLAMAGVAGLCGLAYVLVRKSPARRRQAVAGKHQPTE